jgi:ABC-2 type transport system permease protein
MTIKELIQFTRDAVLVIATIYLFTFRIYVAGSGAGLSLNNAALRIHDSDHSAISRELISRFRQPYFRFDGEIHNEKEAIPLLDKGKAMVILDIPPNFQKDLLSGRHADVQMLVDNSNSILGFLASSYGAQIVADFSQEIAMRNMGLKQMPVIKDKHRVWYNPNQKKEWFMPLSELLTAITLLAMVLPAAAMVREKERGTIEQLLVSPLTPFQIMFPKVLAMIFVILIGTVMSVFLVLEPFFHVPIRGNFILFLIVTVLYVFTSSGIGIFISTIAKNLSQVAMLTILIMLPILFLSGSTTPPEAMPGWLRVAVNFSPLYYYIEASYGIFLKGMGLNILWLKILKMTALGLVVFGIGMWRFRKQFG